MFITGPDVVKTVTGETSRSRNSAALLPMPRAPGRALHRAGRGDAWRTRGTCCRSCRRTTSKRLPWATPADPVDREDASLDTIVPDSPNKPYDMKQVIGRVVDEGDYLEVQPHFAENIVCGFAPPGRPLDRRRRQPAGSACRRPRHRRVREGGGADVRRLQHPSSPSSTCRASFRAPRRSGAGSSATARSSLRVRGGNGAKAHRDHPQGLRRRVRRHELEAHPGGLQRRLADGRGRRHGAGERRQHRLPQRARGRPTRQPAERSSSTTTRSGSRTPTRRQSAGTSTT